MVPTADQKETRKDCCLEIFSPFKGRIGSVLWRNPVKAQGLRTYLSVSLLDELAAVLQVLQQLGVGLIQNTDGLVDEQVWKHVLYSEGHIEDVRNLRRRKT